MYLAACICIMHENTIIGKRFSLCCLFEDIIQGELVQVSLREASHLEPKQLKITIMDVDFSLIGWNIVFHGGRFFFVFLCDHVTNVSRNSILQKHVLQRCVPKKISCIKPATISVKTCSVLDGFISTKHS